MLFIPFWLSMMQSPQGQGLKPSSSSQNPALAMKSSTVPAALLKTPSPKASSPAPLELVTPSKAPAKPTAKHSGKSTPPTMLKEALAKADGIAASMFTLDGHMVSATPSFKKFFADKSIEVSSHMKAESRKKWLSALKHAAENGVVHHMRVECKPCEGHSTRWFHVEIQRQPSPAKKTVMLCLWRDVTAEVLAQREIHRSKLEADFALQARSDFLASMSHELRTPLNAILGFAQMMDQQILGRINNPNYREYIRCIHGSGSELLAKINDLLELANLDIGQVELHEEPVDMNQLMQDVLAAHSHQAFAQGIKIRLDMPANPVWMNIDRLKVQKSLNNLVANALKYSRKHTTVHLTYNKRKTGLVIQIKDQGQGMAQKQYRHVTQLIKNAGVVDRERDTVGMGLVVAKEYAGLHQGCVDIKSKQDQGTTVQFILPLARVLAAPSQKKAAATVSKAKSKILDVA